jgi:hypothetical protein
MGCVEQGCKGGVTNVRITEKSLKATTTHINTISRTRGIGYGLSITRSGDGYAVVRISRAPSPPSYERLQCGMTASEADAFLRGVAAVVQALPNRIQGGGE